MRVAGDYRSADGHPVELSNVQDDLPRGALRRDELQGPVVVTDPVNDDELGVRDRDRIRGVRLILMGIRVRIGNDAQNRGLIPAELGDETAPEVLRGDNLN